MTLLALLLAVAALALLALATDEHHRHRFGHRPAPRTVRRLRGIAWVLLAASFPAAIAARGWVFGPVVWTGLVMLAAGLVFLALHLIPARHASGKGATR
ncbi:DUF3325 domain-containing protein [Sphingomonas sp. KR1UV-12]|uniref:DUF3325 domain-containing protein n=1 Tax=Sphingomonas aurea TaxID=3063994 RepID=A0ABT9EMY4_9SPHN|nr:DUF3325 domain-containing protein [Sphingomonas sp. KR1UV-12]MDP1028153.1 DUF3325 domain-containing protein [Sphingomonas sp. KR1UV-12]